MPEVEVVRREDGEIVGRIATVEDGRWVPETVFGSALGPAVDRDGAIERCLSEGMAALAEPWQREGADPGERLWLLEVGADRLVVSTRDPRYGALPEVLDPRVVRLRRTRWAGGSRTPRAPFRRSRGCHSPRCGCS